MADAPPTPEELAHHATQAAEGAFAAVRSLAGGLDGDEVHKAWEVIHDDRMSSRDKASDSTTWIQHAAMMLLVGVGSEANAAVVATDDVAIDKKSDERLVAIDAAWAALAADRLDEAATLAASAIQVPPTGNKADGKVVHFGNLVLGHVCFRRDDVEGAERHLLAAGDTTGSPTLKSFGPNMALAHALLVRGRTDAVLAYFEKCARFWGDLPRWTRKVKAGGIPDFGANMIYGLPKEVHGLVEAQEGPFGSATSPPDQGT